MEGRMRLAILRGAVAKAILDAKALGNLEAETRALKLFTFFDRVILAQPPRQRGGARNKRQPQMSQIITKRVRLAWQGDWGTLWRDATLLTSKSDKAIRAEKAGVKIAREVEALLDDGLISKALGKITRDSVLASGAGVHASLQQLFPTGSAPQPTEEPTQLDSETREQLNQAVRQAIIKSPKRSGPGPNGSRFEHWRTLASDDVALSAVAAVVVNFLLGEMPEEALRSNLGG